MNRPVVMLSGTISAVVALVSCSGNDEGGTLPVSVGGATNLGVGGYTPTASGGTINSGGRASSGGNALAGGALNGGSNGSGGVTATGSSSSNGGTSVGGSNVGGTTSGGSKAAGGSSAFGGSMSRGGSSTVGGKSSGGTTATGGTANGGTKALGGNSATNGGRASGGAAMGGTATGGMPSGGTTAMGGRASGGAASGGAAKGGSAAGGTSTACSAALSSTFGTPASPTYTTYTLPNAQTACGYNGSNDTIANIAHGTYFAAIPDSSTNFAKGNRCGACVQIGSAIITIVDECPTTGGQNVPCANNLNGHLDLSLAAASAAGVKGDPALTNQAAWKFVPCPVTGNVIVRLKNGNNNEIYIENEILPIASVTCGTQTGSRTSYGAWHFANDVAGQSCTARDIAGRSIDFVVGTSQGQDVNTGKQFPACSG